MPRQQRATLTPTALARKDLSSENTFEFWSRKLGRHVVVFGPSRFDAALILEFDRDVAAYCERPPMQLDLLPAGQGRVRPLDFWVERRNGGQVGVLVFEPTPMLSEDLLRRSMQEAGVRWDVWLSADLAQRQQFVRNLKQLRPYVSSDEPVKEEVTAQITGFLTQFREGRWDQLEAAVQGSSNSEFAQAMAHMYHAGKLDMDLHALPLSSRTWVKAL